MTKHNDMKLIRIVPRFLPCYYMGKYEYMFDNMSCINGISCWDLVHLSNIYTMIAWNTVTILEIISFQNSTWYYLKDFEYDGERYAIVEANHKKGNFHFSKGNLEKVTADWDFICQSIKRNTKPNLYGLDDIDK